MRYYVYIYYYRGVPIYVGKGSGRRAWEHLRLPRDDTPFYRKLKEIKKGGRRPSVVIYACDLREPEAYALERKLILGFGRRPTGTLFNRTDGGDNPPNHKGRRFPHRKSPSIKGKPGRKWSKSARKRHARIMKRVMASPVTRRKCSVAKKGKPGRKHTEESKAKLRATPRKPHPNNSLSKLGRRNPMFGWRWFNDGERARLFDPRFVPRGWMLGRKVPQK